MSIEQRSLFEKYKHEAAITPCTLARISDPEGSKEAAQALVASGRLGAQCEQVLGALKRHGPCTSAELAERSGHDRHMVARRLPDLERRGEVRRLSPEQTAKSKATVWSAK